MEVLIEYDNNGMMMIMSKGECVFHGAEKDFSRSAGAISNFLQRLGARVYTKKVKDLSEEDLLEEY